MFKRNKHLMTLPVVALVATTTSLTGISTASAEDLTEKAFGDFRYTESPNPNNPSETVVTITAYTGTPKDVVIPDTIEGKRVTALGPSAFYDLGLTSLVLNSNLETIGESAFAHNLISSLIIPDSVTTIEPYAFMGNPLTELKLPNNLKVITNSAFAQNSLSEIEIPDSVKQIENFAIQFSSNMKEIKLPKDLEEYSLYATNGSPITNLVVPSKVNLDGLTFEPPGPMELAGPKSVVLLNLSNNNSTTKITDSGMKKINYYVFGGTTAEKIVKNSVLTPKYLSKVLFNNSGIDKGLQIEPMSAQVDNPIYAINDSAVPPKNSSSYKPIATDGSFSTLNINDGQYLHVMTPETLINEVGIPTINLMRTYVYNSSTGFTLTDATEIELDTSSPVEPEQPTTGNPSGTHELNVGLKPGDFAVKYDSMGDFGTAKLSNEMQKVSMPINNLRVIDDRATGEGWTLSISATPVVTDEGDTLPTGSLRIEEYSIQGDATPFNNTANTIDGSSLVLASASEGKGVGTTGIKFLGGNDNALSINFNSVTAKSKTYKSTVTFNLVSGPTN